MKQYTELIGKHQGENAFVFGAGTSLVGLDITPTFDHVNICVNSAILLMSWETGSSDKRYWLSNDALVRKWSYWDIVRKCSANRIVRDSWLKYEDELEGFYVFSPSPTSEDIIDPGDTGLCYCSSVPSSIDLAIQMGAKNIYVMGLDQYTIVDKRYFWQYWPRKKQPHHKNGVTLLAPLTQQRWTFGYDMKAYKALLGFAETKNVDIYNCNVNSRVSIFPKIEFSKALEMIGK